MSIFERSTEVNSALRHVAVPAARHVGDHRVRVELRVEVAARQVAEGRRDHAVGPAHAACRPVSGS